VFSIHAPSCEKEDSIVWFLLLDFRFSGEAILSSDVRAVARWPVLQRRARFVFLHHHFLLFAEEAIFHFDTRFIQTFNKSPTEAIESAPTKKPCQIEIVLLQLTSQRDVGLVGTITIISESRDLSVEPVGVALSEETAYSMVQVPEKHVPRAWGPIVVVCHG